MVERSASLLAAGITDVSGSFVAGDPVDLVDADGHRWPADWLNFDADEIPRLDRHNVDT